MASDALAVLYLSRTWGGWRFSIRCELQPPKRVSKVRNETAKALNRDNVHRPSLKISVRGSERPATILDSLSSEWQLGKDRPRQIQFGIQCRSPALKKRPARFKVVLSLPNGKREVGLDNKTACRRPGDDARKVRKSEVSLKNGDEIHDSYIEIRQYESSAKKPSFLMVA